MPSPRLPFTLITTFSEYTATRTLGNGGAGVVYEATQTDGGPVAIKVLHERATTDHRKRMKNEIGFLQRSTHKNIVPLLDHGVLSDGNRPFYVMPRFDCDLAKWVETERGPEALLQAYGEILDGVEAAHLQGVHHRDLKPKNVLVAMKPQLVAVADFGIAHFRQEDLLTAVKTLPGDRLANFAYSAPEQRVRGANVDHRSDIYALGLILNEMFTRTVPSGVNYATIASVNRELGFLDPIVEKMLDANPSARPQSIEAVKIEIRRAREGIVALQRVSEIEKRVIRADEIDDPLALEVVRVVDAKWVPNTLTLTLSREVNEKWREALRRRVRQWPMGRGPDDVMYRGRTAAIGCDESGVQTTIDEFKSWLPGAREAYLDILESEAKQRATEAERERQADRDRQERILRANRDLRF